MVLSFVRSLSCLVFVWDQRTMFTNVSVFVSRHILVLWGRWQDAGAYDVLGVTTWGPGF